MRVHDGGVFRTGIPLSAGIYKDRFSVEGQHQDSGGSITARGCGIDDSHSFRGLNYVDALLLQVPCRRRHPSGFQDRSNLLQLYLLVAVLLAGLPRLDQLCVFHWFAFFI